MLFATGHVKTLSNEDNAYTVDVGISPYDALEHILTMFERAGDQR